MLKRSLLAVAVIAMLCTAVTTRVRSQQQQGFQLPEGNGKALVQVTCTTCHGLNQMANAGFTREEWQTIVSSMVDLPKNQTDVFLNYLSTNFPPGAKPPAVLIPGDVSVSIKEWVVPSKGSRPHDPLAAADGSIWWTGQWANVLGRLDPETGVMKEFPLETPRSGPHGLAADKDGNIWYTGNFVGEVGKLNPKTGEVTEYPMPDKAARDPHTPTFDQKGTLWFTLQGSNMVGRLIPSTGEVKLATAPTPRSNPYGIVVDSKGTPWFVQVGVNKLASIDPNTMEIKEYTLPNPDTRPRRVAITKDDVLWYADYSRGYLGRFDPKTGKVTDWPSPGGPKSQPYGIAAVGDAIWYSESGVRPNTLVRFDTKTSKFQTWAIPSGGGVVRNMMATPEGNLVLACSGRMRVALVEVKNPIARNN